MNPIRRLFSAAASAMSFLAGEKQAPPGPDDDFWYQTATFAAASGIRVTPENAMRVATVFACVRALSETMAALPLHVYEFLADGRSRRLAREHPLYDVLRNRPNAWQTAFEFREMLMGHLVLRGNAYCRILAGSRGAVDQLIPLHPARMSVDQLVNGRLLYTFRTPEGRQEPFSQEEIFHLRGLSSDGLVGLSVIEAAQDAIGLAKATESHGARLFRNGARPGVVLETDNALKPEACENLRVSWERVHAGVDNAHRTAVLTNGLKAHELGMSSEDAQFLETRRYQREEICGIFRVPLQMVQDTAKAAYNSLEHQDTAFAKHTMLPWCRRWEGAIQRDLIADPGFFAEFNLDGLARGDLGARTTHYTQMLSSGVYSINEVRERENLNPIDGGDEHRVQLATAPLGQSPANDANRAKDEDEEEEGEEEAKGFGARAALAPLLEDAAVRIAAAEIRGLAARAAKAADDPPKFRAWLNAFYAGHREYVDKVLAPIAAASKAVGGAVFWDSATFCPAPAALDAEHDWPAAVARLRATRAAEVLQILHAMFLKPAAFNP